LRAPVVDAIRQARRETIDNRIARNCGFGNGGGLDT
jgi:hypothetical protein